MNRAEKLQHWINCLEEAGKEFPGDNISINTIIRSFKSQLKELEKKI